MYRQFFGKNMKRQRAADSREYRQQAYKRSRMDATGPYMAMPRYIKPRGFIAPQVPMSSRAVISQGEKKYVDSGFLSIAPTPVAAPGGYTLNDIDIGAGPYQRIGRKINLRSYRIQGSLQINPAANAVFPDAIYRMVVVYDRQCNGVAPSWSDVFQATIKTGASGSTAYDHPNLNNTERFLILENHVVYQPQMTFSGPGFTNNTGNAYGSLEGATSGDQALKKANAFSYYRKINLETVYKSSSNVVPNSVVDIASGSLFAWFVTSSSTGTPLVFQVSIRLCFQDA